jgi:hypothetical protein
MYTCSEAINTKTGTDTNQLTKLMNIIRLQCYVLYIVSTYMLRCLT